MSSKQKLALVALFLGFLFSFALLSRFQTTPAFATPLSLTVNGAATASGVVGGTPVTVIARWNDEPNGTTMTLCFNQPAPSCTTSSVGTFLTAATLSFNNDGQTINVSGNTITVSEDADSAPETTTLDAQFQCIAVGTAQLQFTHASASTIATITCTSSSGGTTDCVNGPFI